MASANPLAAIPAGVSYPLHLVLGQGESSTEGSKKRKRSSNQVLGLRYNFKPASITPETPGALYTGNGTRSLKFDLAAGGQQVFDTREELGKSRECVMIWNEDAQTFTLQPLSSTLHLTLNRNASSNSSTSAPLPTFTPTRHPEPPRKDSVTSSSSSTAVPLAEADGSRKRSRPSAVYAEPAPTSTTANRPVRSGKTVPRKQPPAPAAASASSKGKGKAGARKKLPPTPKRSRTESAPTKTPEKNGKIKSSEIIEDSDEEAAVYDQEVGKGEEEDEFAMLLGASLAGGDEDEDDDEDDDEEEDDDEALGGAKVVLNGDGSEWL